MTRQNTVQVPAPSMRDRAHRLDAAQQYLALGGGRHGVGGGLLRAQLLQACSDAQVGGEVAGCSYRGGGAPQRRQDVLDDLGELGWVLGPRVAAFESARDHV